MKPTPASTGVWVISRSMIRAPSTTAATPAKNATTVTDTRLQPSAIDRAAPRNIAPYITDISPKAELYWPMMGQVAVM